MTIFDFHTHAFVDSLASRALSGLEQTSGISPSTDGTIAGLRNMMRSRNISAAMLLPVATKPSQQTTINNWAASVMGGCLYACGSVHPDAEDAVKEVERIAQLGLYGVKFHSEYQHFRPNEERMMPVYRKARELGLFVVFHGGWDPFGGEEILASPRTFADLAEKMPGLTIIAAHMGGIKLYDQVEDCLAGRFPDLYMDTGVVADYISDEQLLRIIEKQGADKVLFGSDTPWDHPEKEIAMIGRLPLSDQEKEMIFHINAEKLINKRDTAG
ncbi:MAG: amidohydrolase [Ruminococcus sp.]|nr:amidohydrolase [Ruminococcus sp.]